MLSRDNPLRIVIGLVARINGAFWNWLRIQRLKRKGVRFLGKAYVYPGIHIERRAGITIGAGSNIGKCHFLAVDKIVVGERTLIGHGVLLCAGGHDIYSDEFKTTTAPIVIGNGVWIATGATIMPGVKVGDGAVVSAKAVVFRNVPPGAVAVGNPAQILPLGRTTTEAFDPLALASIDPGVSLARLRALFRRKKAD